MSKLFRSSILVVPAVAGLAITGLVLPGTARTESTPSPSPASRAARIDADLARMALSFEKNHGQTDRRVKLLSRTAGGTLFLTPNEAVLSLHSGPEEATAARGSVMRMHLVGGNPDAEVVGVEDLAGKVNYLSADPANTHSNVPTYSRAETKGVYPGIDMAWYGTGSNLEYDFIVAPGADPSSIQLGFEGVKDLRLDRAGGLVMNVGNQEVRQHKPVLYQERAGKRTAVPGRFVLGANDRIGFSVGSYDATRRLVIDPVIVWSSYLGGGGQDVAHEIEVDGAGSVWLAGFTASVNFPLTNPFDATVGPGFGNSYFITKVVGSTTPSLAYSTYLDNDFGVQRGSVSFAVDATGSPILAGQVFGPGLPTTAGAFQEVSPREDYQDFVAKLTPDGSALSYATYLSYATGRLNIVALDVDASGDIYVGGRVANFGNVADAPQGTPGAFKETCTPSTAGECTDAFLARLHPAGNGPADLTYLTYIGGNDGDVLQDIDVDPSGVLYLAGSTTSNAASLSDPLFPTTEGAVDREGGANINGQADDAWVAKFSALGNGPSDLLYSTLLAGDTGDTALRAAAGPGGAIYAVGVTKDYRSVGAESGTNFPTTPGALQTDFTPGEDFSGNAFLVKIDPAGNGSSDLVYSTLLGGRRADTANGLVVDTNGWAYLAGRTLSDTFPKKNAIQGVCYCFYDLNTSDAFVAVVNPDPNDPNGGTGDRGDLLFGTFLGGTGVDSASDIALSAGAKMLVTGTTNGPGGPPPGIQFPKHFPRKAPFQKAYAGGASDAFVLKISRVFAP